MRQFNRFRGTKGFLSTWNRAVRFRYMITEAAKNRTKILAFWKKHGAEAAEEAYGVKIRTLYGWQRRLKEGNGKLEALNPGSRTPMEVSMATKDENENEACRRIMISLYGSEEAATEVAQALLHQITPAEEARIKRVYDAADKEAARVFEGMTKKTHKE